MADRTATVVVIGAGQAGLSAGHHLQQRGYVSALDEPEVPRTFVMLDADAAPGGAWQHRWQSLRMATVNGIFDLPGMPQPAVDPDEPSRDAVPRYFAAYERRLGLPIVRPASVTAVTRADDDPDGELVVESTVGTWRARAIINATGTWNNPQLPHYPGAETFAGAQLHARDYVSADAFQGRTVAVVGGGITAVQLLEELSAVTRTRWYTRREPVFLDTEFQPETTGRDVIARVTADAEEGIPTGSVVSYTGLAWTPYALRAKARGALERRPMFLGIEPRGVREADGSFTTVDVLLWATGYKPALAHLEPLGLRNERGVVQVAGTRAVVEPRVHLVGFGPSQSTVGANRAGRAAVREVDRLLDADGATAA